MTWPIVKLKHIARTVAGGTPDVSDSENWTDSNDGYPWVAISDMSNRQFVTETARQITARGLRLVRLKVAPPGTLLFSMYASLGHVAVLTKAAVWNQAILGIVPGPDVDSRYLAYALEALKGRLSEFARSNTQENLNAEQVGNLPIPLPAIDEQRRIARFLDFETAKLSALSKAKERQINVLDEDAFASISETVIPGSLSVPKGVGLMSWLPKGKLSEPLVRLRYVASLQAGVTVDSARRIEGIGVTRPYLRVANVQAGGLDLKNITAITVSASAARRSTLRYGDVLMTEGGDLDKLGRGTVWRNEIPNSLHQNHVFAIRPLPEKLDPEYLALVTQSLHGRCYFESTGTKTTNLASTSAGKILAFPIPLPPIEVQRRRVHALSRRLERIDSWRSILRSQLLLLKERRQAIVTAVVMGTIRL